MSSSQELTQNFKCYEKILPIKQGINISNFTDLNRDECEQKCIENIDCNAFAWNRSDNTCNLKKQFNSDNIFLKNDFENFDFCYNIDKEIDELNKEIDSLNSDIAESEKEKNITENNLKSADLTILSIAESITSDTELMAFISANIDSNDSEIELESLVNEIKELKKTIIDDSTTIKSLEIKSKRYDTLEKKQILSDLSKSQKIEVDSSTPTKINNITTPYAYDDSSIESFGNQKLNYMEKFNNYLKNHEKCLQEINNKKLEKFLLFKR